ncbi:MAG TPA: rhomboid family intramembrane serine protease [Terriglobales bacterium]|nr:rhomboid family intramembrane serine protease [Terriglobales bacterium]
MSSYRSYGGGGGRRYSGGGGGMTLSFPPFYGAVKTLVLINVGVFFLQLLLGIFYRPALGPFGFLELIPAAVMHGHVYQIITYAFLHEGFFHILFNMLMLWMFGAQLESGWGRRQFYEFYFFCLIGAALLTIAVSYTGVMGVTPYVATVGASGAVFGLIVAFGMIYGEQEVMLMLPPVSIKAKYMAIVLVLIELALALGASREPGQNIAYTAHLGGALFGWIYVRFFPRQGMRFLASERYYGLRNSYYRWKRRRAARKFEVYMRKHDRNEYFDQYGNYKAPDDKEKGNGEGGRSGWVN